MILLVQKSIIVCNLVILYAVQIASAIETSNSLDVVELNDAVQRYPNELVHLRGHTILDNYHSPLPHTYINVDDLPTSFSWDNVNGTNYLTKSLNQHIPQWCGSCWAHAALSSLADRIKIVRRAATDDINLSVQYLLNCGNDVAGSCLGGSSSGTYQFIHETGFIPYDTCQPYIACSKDSKFGFCPFTNTSCSAFTTCSTCTMKLVPSIHPFSEVCREIDQFPNATVAEYGTIELKEENGDAMIVMKKVQAEIFARGPVTAAINGQALHNYRGGIIDDTKSSRNTTHAVSIVGWDVNINDRSTHYIVRNSWGEYFGELGYFRIKAGENILGIEEEIVWATPGQFTTMNYPCYEDGTDCGQTTGTRSQHYVDPSSNLQTILRRLAHHQKAR